MGKLNINNGGVDTNKKMADIDERFGPYANLGAANAALGSQGRNTITAGLTVGILTANAGVKEWWYQPNKKTGQLELIPKGGNAADNPTEGNFASFDENGNVVDSGNKATDFAPMEQAVPMGDTEDVGKILEKQANGFGWVEKPVDGADAYGVYVKEYKEEHEGSTEGVLTKSQWLASLKGEKGDNAVNPFKGIYGSNNKPTGTFAIGDYLYAPTSASGQTGNTIWKWNGTTWQDSGETPDIANAETFASSETLQQVAIDDSHLVDPVNTADSTKPVLAKAEDVMQLKAKLGGVTASDVKVNAVVGTNVTTGAYVSGETGLLVTPGSSASSYAYFELAIPQGTKRIRFATGTEKSESKIGYSVGYYDNDTYVPTRKFYFDTAEDTPPTGIVEKVVEILDGETTFMTTVASVSTYASITLDKFYCYLQSGTSVGEELADKASYSDMEGLWMWKKNLINQDGLLYGGVYVSKDSSFEHDENGYTTNYPNGIMSNKLYLEEGVIYTVSNVNAYKTSPYTIDSNCLINIASFNSEGEYLGNKTYTGTLKKTDSNPNKNTANATFTYTKHRNSETGEIDEAYCRIRLRFHAVPNDTTWNDYKNAQLEVGTEVTELVPYHSEKVFDIATKRDVAEAKESVQEEVNLINENIFTEEEELVLVERDYEFKNGNGSYLHNKSFSTNPIMEEPDNTLAFTKSNKWAVVRYEVENTKTYIGKTLSAGNNNGVYIFYWADIQKKFIKRESKTPVSGWTIKRLTPPANAVYLYIQTLDSTVNQVSLEEVITINKPIKDIIDENMNNIIEKIDSIESNKDSIKVLVIGDSFVIDPFAYVPIMLQRMYKDIDFVIGIAMESYQSTPDIGLNGFYHGTIAAHLRFLTIQEDYDKYNYYKYSSDNSSWSYSEEKLKDTLTDEDWDCIVIRANYQSGITSDGNIKYIDNDDPNNPTHVNGYGENYNYDNLVDRLRNAIMKHVNHPVKFGALIPQRSPKDFFPDPNSSNPTDSLVVVNSIDGSIQSVFSAAQLYMQYSFFDFVIPVGTALQNARHIEQLRAFGDGINYEGVWNTTLNRWDVYPNNTNAGYMNCRDAHHLQDGIGREICAYTICLKLLELAYNQKSIFGDKNYILKEDVNNYLVPAQKGSTAAGFIVKNDEYSETKNLNIENYNQCLLRIMQKCCQLAIKNPYIIATNMDTICAVDIEELNGLKSAIDNED